MSVHSALSVFLLVSVGLAWGHIIVEVPSNDLEAATCPHEAIPNTHFTVPFILLSKQYECYKPSSLFLGQLNSASNTAAYRSIFQKACLQTPEVKTCIKNVAKDADVCLKTSDRTMFKTVRDFIENSIDTTCADDSETVARMYGEELKQLDFSSQIRVLSCMTSVATKTEYKNDSDVAVYTMRRYKAMQAGKQCIVNVARGKRKPTAQFERFVGHLLEGMECIHPSTQEVVTCHSIDSQDSSSSESSEN